MAKKTALVILIALLVIGLVIAAGAFYLFFYYRSCADEGCFLFELRDCQRAKYISETGGNAWQYFVEGSSRGACKVTVKNIAVADASFSSIVGKKMTCRVPKEQAGTFIELQQRLEFCSGPLKESLQEIVIDKLYTYIIQHIGEITEDVRGV